MTDDIKLLEYFLLIKEALEKHDVGPGRTIIKTPVKEALEEHKEETREQLPKRVQKEHNRNG